MTEKVSGHYEVKNNTMGFEDYIFCQAPSRLWFPLVWVCVYKLLIKGTFQLYLNMALNWEHNISAVTALLTSDGVRCLISLKIAAKKTPSERWSRHTAPLHRKMQSERTGGRWRWRGFAVLDPFHRFNGVISMNHWLQLFPWPSLSQSSALVLFLTLDFSLLKSLRARK